MPKSSLVLIISGVFALLYIVGVVFCCGHGGKLLGGYHYQPKTSRAMKYHKKIMLPIGLFFLVMVACLHGALICAIYHIIIGLILLVIASVVVGISMVFYVNCSKKIAKLMVLERDDYQEEECINEVHSKKN